MNPMVSYAQNGEDVMLRRVFDGQEKGFYIDIGASHPEKLSVTKHFYDLGWRGINIDPLKNNIALFEQQRPEDINLAVAIGEENKFVTFYKVCDYTELSTTTEVVANAYSEHEVSSFQVEQITGNQLFEKYVQGPVDFLKIDVEGGEPGVIKSIDFRRCRPKVLIVEATVPNAPFPGWKGIESIETYAEWEPLLLNSGYIFAYFDGLNRFYVSQEHKDFLSYFQVGLCHWDNYVPHSLASRIAELEWHCAERMKQIEILQEHLDRYRFWQRSSE